MGVVSYYGGYFPIMGGIKIPGTCFFRKKKAPARQPRVVVGIGLLKNHQNTCFRAKVT